MSDQVDTRFLSDGLLARLSQMLQRKIVLAQWTYCSLLCSHYDINFQVKIAQSKQLIYKNISFLMQAIKHVWFFGQHLFIFFSKLCSRQKLNFQRRSKFDKITVPSSSHFIQNSFFLNEFNGWVFKNGISPPLSLHLQMESVCVVVEVGMKYAKSF